MQHHHTPPSQIVPFPEQATSKRYTISYHRSPFLEDPDVKLVGLNWATVRKFALGNVYPQGWRVVEETSGEELELAEIGQAYATLSR